MIRITNLNGDGINFNLLTTVGMYYQLSAIQQSSNHPTWPTGQQGTQGFLFVGGYYYQRLTQILVDEYNVWFRSRTSEEWGSWKRLAFVS